MHRPTRISLVGMLIVPLWALFWSASGSGEEGKTAQLLKMYQECVFDAVASQVKNGSAEVNPSAATEVAFQACRTEEQAIFAHASAGGVSASQANQVITDYKLSLKQKIRKVFANSERRRSSAGGAAVSCSGGPRPTPSWLRVELQEVRRGNSLHELQLDLAEASVSWRSSRG